MQGCYTVPAAGLGVSKFKIVLSRGSICLPSGVSAGAGGESASSEAPRGLEMPFEDAG